MLHNKKPRRAGVFCFAVVSLRYLLAVLSRNGLLIAVVDVIVMSPLAVTVYTFAGVKATAVLAMALVDDPAYLVLKS